MTSELLAKMNNAAHEWQQLQKELRNDPSEPAQFCSRLLGSGVATMDMRLGEQYGIRLQPAPLESEAPAAHKAKKQD